MKTVAFFAFLFSSCSWASSCKVYGISDGPQRFLCTFHDTSVELTCKEGQYLLNGMKVERAFHLEVEEGSTPLVFQAKTMTLTVLEESGIYEAELVMDKKNFLGACRIP